jgi:hypothetical protein
VVDIVERFRIRHALLRETQSRRSEGNGHCLL